MGEPEKTLKEVQPEPAMQQPPERVTPRAFALGLLTIVGLCIFAENYGRGMVRSFMPIPAQLMFMVWIVIYILLKLTLPRFALTRTEVLAIFGMAWLVGTLPGLGLVGKLVADVTGPAYFSSPEDRFWEVVGPYMPNFLFFEQGNPAVDKFYLGLAPGESIPWGEWFTRLYWWFVGTLGVVVAGFFASVIFYKQWAQNERLAFPLAHFPLELLKETGGSRLPDIFKSRAFWVGFACTFGVIAYQMASWRILDLPRIGVLEHQIYNDVTLARDFPPFNTRIHPFLLGLAYHCPLNILFNFWFFYLLNILREGMMNRTGFSVGLEGQPATPKEILTLEAHGALVVLVVWSVWVARGHLKETFQKAFSRRRSEDDGVPVTYRTAWLGFMASAIFMLGWFVSVGFNPPVALLQMAMLFVIYFGMAKYAAATGFVFLRVPGNKGVVILKSILGTAEFTPRNLVGMMLVDRNGFAGHPIRMLSIPATPHFFHILGNALRRHPLVTLALPVSLLVGYTVQCWANIHNVHLHSGMNVGMVGVWRSMMGQVPTIEGSDLTYFDPQKLLVWVFGGVEAALLTLLSTRFAAFPLHPLGMAFPTRYGFTAFLIWLPKLIILRYGGVALYRRSIPFWYGLVVGYIMGNWAAKLIAIAFIPYVRGYGAWFVVHYW